MRVFIEVSAHTYMSICVASQKKKKKRALLRVKLIAETFSKSQDKSHHPNLVV
jgi:predicted RNA-binding protein YlxR (DUF448 family)